MSIAQQGADIPITANGSIVFNSTPSNGDLIILVAGSTSTPTFPAAFQADAAGGAGQLVAIRSKIASSETNAYTVGGLAGTGAAAIGVVFRATNGFKQSGGNATAELGTVAASATVDPAGNPSVASAVLVSVNKHSGSLAAATCAWNGGSAGTPLEIQARTALDRIILTSIPADTKAVWSVGAETALVAYTEISSAVNAGFFPM